MACSAISCSRVMVTTIGGVDACGLRGGVDRVALDVLDERLAEAPAQGLPVAGVVAELGLGVAGRVGEREEVALEHRAHVGRHREPAVAAPLAVVDQVSSTPAAARASSPASTDSSWHSPTSGATTSRMRLPICLRSRASWWAASSSRVDSASPRVSSSTCEGSASTASTITRACSVRSAPDVSAVATSVVLLERPAEGQVATRLASGRPRPDRQPRRSVAQPVLLAHVGGGGQHPSGQCVELRAGLDQRHQRRLLLPHRHERRLDRRDALHRGLDVGGTADDGMHSIHRMQWGHLLARAHWTPPGSGAER